MSNDVLNDRLGVLSNSSVQEPHEQRSILDNGQIIIGEFLIPLDWPVQGEAGKTFARKLTNGFFKRYMAGSVVLDVGYKGGHEHGVPILPHAIGIDLGYRDYDGVRLPFEELSVDTIYSSHMLEHVPDPKAVLRDWFRVLKLGGFIICIVPHQYLYERRVNLPSQWSGEHLRFYTPGSLLREFEDCFEPNTYRIRHLADNDLGYVYDQSPDQHPSGCYEIELVVEKLRRPSWNLK